MFIEKELRLLADVLEERIEIDADSVTDSLPYPVGPEGS